MPRFPDGARAARHPRPGPARAGARPGDGARPGRTRPRRPEVGRADGAVQPARLRGRVRVDGDADVRRRAGAGALGKERRPGRGGPRAADRAPDAGATGDNMTDWYYHDPAQGRVGPLSAEQVRARYVDRRIQRSEEQKYELQSIMRN